MSFILNPFTFGSSNPAVSSSYIGLTTLGSMTTDTISATAVSIGSAVSNRIVFLMIHWYSNVIAPLSSATIGGIAATIHCNNNTTTGGAVKLGMAIISAAVPTGTTANVSLTFSAGAAYHSVTFSTFTATGILSLTPIDTISANPANVTSYSGTIDVQKDGLLLFGAMAYSSNTGYTISGATQYYTTVFGSGGSPSYRGVGSSLVPSLTEANRTMGITRVGSFSFYATVVGASFR